MYGTGVEFSIPGLTQLHIALQDGLGDVWQGLREQSILLVTLLGCDGVLSGGVTMALYAVVPYMGLPE